MAGSTLALLLFSLAVAAAVPQNDRILDSINWPEEAPTWWPSSFRWPPALPEDAPSFWPDWLPWPIEMPTAWPPKPEWWPDSLSWPPTLPDAWPDKPDWWPDSMNWPPNRPQQWPDRPANWPAHLPWPPTKPEHWPERPSFWPESLPWPPAMPDQWPDRPEWLPDLVPWPPALPEFEWPPPGVDPSIIPYIPSRDNEFHLFTRYNPAVSYPLVINNYGLLQNSHFRPRNPTIVLVHNIRESAYASINSILVPAYLNTVDANVIVVDWSAGAWSETAISTLYSVASGNFVARFLDWLTVASGAHHNDIHLIGVGLGGLKVGFIGLRLNRQVGYITALDPAQGPELTRYLPPLSPNVAKYTEVIHTDAGYKSWAQPLGHVDFYPNGGQYQPGCGGESTCNRNRAIYFLAESIQYGGFTGVQCHDWRDALTGNCYGPKTLKLGGLKPKTGKRGVFYVRTNAVPPFSQG